MKAVRVEKFGGPEVLDLRDVPDPHPAPGEVRVRVAAAGLNPMDWKLIAMPEAAARFGLALPTGFGYDFAGVVDELGADVEGFSAGDRVFGGAMSRAVAAFLVIDPHDGNLFHTPDAISDAVASTLPIAGTSAEAALAAVDLKPGDTILVGGAAGGVGVFAVQLAKLAGARVIGTCSEGTFDFLLSLGAEPVAYGEGLAGRVRALAPGGISAATDLIGTETVQAALELGVAPRRISTIAAGLNPPGGARATGGAQATPGALQRIADIVAAGDLTVPIAATFPLEQVREAVALQRAGHVHGKVVVTL